MLLPILNKELIELAGRLQTYITRVVYALIVFVLFYGMYRSMGLRDLSMLDLGKGTGLLQKIFLMQIASIYLFVPPIISTSITDEKEKGTIVTLVSLPMTGWEILLQKLFGRLLPVLTLLALSFPLYAIAYTLGGINAATVGVAATCLVLECLKVGAFALMVSCTQKTNTLAVFFTYMWLLLLAPLCTSPLMTVLVWANFDSMFLFWQFVVGIPCTLIFLGVGAKMLRKHALHMPEAYQYAWQVPLEGENMNPLVHKHNPWVLPRKDLPKDEPLRWVETPRDWMTSNQALLLAGMTMLVMLLPLLQLDAAANFGAPVMVICWLILLVRTPIKVAHSHSRAVDGEVSQVLLTTPMTGWDMLRQTNAARGEGFIKVFWFMLAGTIVHTTVAAVGRGDGLLSSLLLSLLYLGASISMFTVYYFFQVWFGTLLALRIRSKAKCLIALLMVNLAIFAVIPLFLIDIQSNGPALHRFFGWLDPMIFMMMVEDLLLDTQKPVQIHALSAILITLLIWTALTAGLRIYTLNRADRLLGRPV